MADKNANKEDLKETLALCRKRDLAFGLCLGKKAEGTVLVTHKTKAPKVLGQQAKGEGETGHFTFGMMSVQGKDLTLSVMGNIPSGIHRKIKELLKFNGLTMKVHILDPSGAALDDEDGAENDDPPGASDDAGGRTQGDDGDPAAGPAGADDEDPLARKWAVTAEEVDARFEKLGGQVGTDLTKADAEWKVIRKLAEAGQFEAALAGVKILSDHFREIEQAASRSDALKKDLAAKWEAARAQLEPHVEAAIAGGATAAKKIQAVWAMAKAKAEGPSPDYATALKAVGMVSGLVGSAQEEIGARSAAPGRVFASGPNPDEARPGGGSGAGAGAGANVAPAAGSVDVREAGPGGGATGTGTTTGGAASGAPDAAGGASATAAPAPADLPDPIATAVPEVVADLSGAIEDKIKRLLDGVAALGTGPVKTYDDLIPSAKSKAPGAWGTELKRLDDLGEGMKSAPETAEDAKLDAALTALAKLETEIRRQIALKEAFKAALEVFDLRLVPIDNHPQARAKEILPEIKSLRDGRNAAVDLSRGHDHSKARKALKDLAPTADRVELLADEFAHFDAIQLPRKVMAQKYAGKPAGAAQLDGLQAEIKKHYDDAMAAKGVKDYKSAVDALDRIPDKFSKLETLRARKSDYDEFIRDSVPTLNRLNGLSEDERKPAQQLLDHCNAEYEAGKIENTGDYAKSMDHWQSIDSTVSHASRQIFAGRNFAAALKLVEDQVQTFKTHPGTGGILEPIAAMERDIAMAQAEANGNRHSVGTAILTRSMDDWPEITARARAFEIYSARRITVQAKIDGLAGRAEAATVLQQARDLMALAAKQAIRHDYDAARDSLKDADDRADDAKEVADAKDSFAAMADGGKIDNLGADWAAARKVYSTMRAKLASGDKDRAFTALLEQADAPVAQAEAARDAGNIEEAKRLLNSAIDLLKAAQDKVLAHKPFKKHLQSTEKDIARVERLNRKKGGSLQVFIDEAKRLVAEAKAKIAPPDHDYAAGEAALTEATDSCARAEDAASQYDQIDKNIGKAEAVLVTLSGETPTVVTQLDHRRIETQAMIDEARRLLGAGDFGKAAVEAGRAGAMQAVIEEDIELVKLCFVRETYWYKNWLTRIDGPGKEAGAKQLLIVNEKYARFQALMASHNYKAASEVIGDVSLAVSLCNKIILGEASYSPVKTATTTTLDNVKAARNAHVESRVVDLETRYTKAEELAGETLYLQAERAMSDIGRDATELLPIALASGSYEPARKAAEDRLLEAEGHAQADAVAANLKRLRGKYEAALKYAADLRFATAEPMLNEVAAAAAEAIVTADTHQRLEDVNGMIAGASGDDTWMLQIAAAKASIAHVEGKDTDRIATTIIAEARSQIATAETTDGGASKAALVAALEACNTANAAIAQYAFIKQAVADARARIADLRTHAHAAIVAEDIAAMETRIDGAEATAKTGLTLDKVASDVEEVMEKFHLLVAFPDFYQKYIDLRAKPELEPRLAELEQHEHRYAIKPSIDDMRRKLDEAENLAEDRKLEAAFKLLEKAREIGSSAKVMADMRANTPPTEDEIKEIIARPNGIDELDAMIDNLEPEAQRAVVKVAFKVRFGCEIENFNSPDFAAPGSVVPDGKKAGPNIVAFYKAMEKLPLDHTRDNDKMSKFKILDKTDDGTSWYSPSEKEIVMDVGDANKSRTEPVASPHEVGSPDDATTPEERAELEKFRPANDDPVTSFNWTTLHEVGHAVDDSQRYMARKGAAADHGGWKEHGADVEPIAAKFVAEYKYDKSYIIAFMSGRSNPPLPQKPAADPCSEEEWEARRIAVCKHISMCLESASPWYSLSTSRKIALGGRVYQEAYANTWVSYDLAARSKGITGYQFRAPAEWFAELYAAYHSDKLKPTHPSVAWLSTL